MFVRKVYDGVLKSKQSEFIPCSDNSNRAYFSKSRSKKNDSFSCDVLIEKINSIINNSYIVYHDVVYRQKIGIPMGTNCAPFLPNIFLHVFRHHYSNMYLIEMTLENTNISKAVCAFLDLRISIFRGKFRYCSYDKRKDFNFDTCNFPDLNGNVPWGGSYGVFISQLPNPRLHNDLLKLTS